MYNLPIDCRRDLTKEQLFPMYWINKIEDKRKSLKDCIYEIQIHFRIKEIFFILIFINKILLRLKNINGDIHPKIHRSCTFTLKAFNFQKIYLKHKFFQLFIHEHTFFSI